MNIDSWYVENLVCPRDHSRLILENDKLHCLNDQHGYPLVEGIPVMLLDDKEQTMELVYNSIRRAKGELVDLRSPDLYLESIGGSEEEKTLAVSLVGKTKIDPIVSVIIGATSGNLYKAMIGKLESYPIPELRLENGHGKRLLDMGCNWGRWSIAAYKLGYQVVGIDPSLGAIMAARRVSNSMGCDIKYVVADGRFLPFNNKYFDVVFSYSVLQHLDRRNVELCLEEISRLLKNEGYSFI
jgi:SAM-dependent methyltransferase